MRARLAPIKQGLNSDLQSQLLGREKEVEKLKQALDEVAERSISGGGSLESLRCGRERGQRARWRMGLGLSRVGKAMHSWRCRLWCHANQRYPAATLPAAAHMPTATRARSPSWAAAAGRRPGRRALCRRRTLQVGARQGQEGRLYGRGGGRRWRGMCSVLRPTLLQTWSAAAHLETHTATSTPCRAAGADNLHKGFTEQVDRLRAFLQRLGLDQHAGGNLSEQQASELTGMVGRSCQLCQAALRVTTVQVGELVSRDPATLSSGGWVGGWVGDIACVRHHLQLCMHACLELCCRAGVWQIPGCSRTSGAAAGMACRACASATWLSRPPCLVPKQPDCTPPSRPFHCSLQSTMRRSVRGGRAAWRPCG